MIVADVKIAFDFAVSLTPNEFRLVTLGLSRGLKGADVQEAKALGAKLLAGRAKLVTEYATSATAAAEKAAKEVSTDTAAKDGTAEADGADPAPI